MRIFSRRKAPLIAYSGYLSIVCQQSSANVNTDDEIVYINERFCEMTYICWTRTNIGCRQTGSDLVLKPESGML